MELANPPRREFQRAALGGGQRAARRLHLRGLHAQTGGRQLHVMEASAEFDQSAVAAPAHGGDYPGHRRVERGAVTTAPLEHRVKKPAKRGAIRVQNYELHVISSRAASSSDSRSTDA